MKLFKQTHQSNSKDEEAYLAHGLYSRKNMYPLCIKTLDRFNLAVLNQFMFLIMLIYAILLADKKNQFTCRGGVKSLQKEG